MLSNSLFPGFWRSFSLWALVCALCAPLAGFAQVAPYSFSPQTGVAPGTLVTSNAIQVSATAASSPISIVGGEYSLNNVTFTSASAFVSSCQRVWVRLRASSSFGTTTSATLNIGGVTGVFTVTTAAAPAVPAPPPAPAADTVPNAFNFAAQTGVALSTATLSNSITVTGTNTGSPISVSGGEYQINGGAFTTAAGTVNSGDTVAVRVTSAGTYATTMQGTLTIGGVSGTFSVTTLAEPSSTLTLSATTLNFIQPGLGIGSASAPRSVTVTNTGGAAVAISAVGVGGAAASDFSQTNTCGSSLAAGASCTVSVTFTPSAAGARVAEITFTTRPSTPNRIGLIGNRNAGLANDVNGDGRSDILWRHSATGQLVMWPMDVFSVTGGALVNTVDPGWEIVGSGDFNGDGKSDVLWQHGAAGHVVVWLMNGTTIQSGALVTTLDPGWQVVGTGDFNGDGMADILLRNSGTGANRIWLMNGVTRQAVVSVNAVDPGWQVAGTGDFNGDGKSDILWRHSAAGHVVVWLMNGTTIQSGALVNSVDPAWQIAGTGDFNGDGKSDVLWRHSAAGHVVVWQMNGATIQSGALANTVADLGWVVGETGDFNGDGKSDILWRHRVTGNNQVWMMDGARVSSTGNLPTVDLGWVVAR